MKFTIKSSEPKEEPKIELYLIEEDGIIKLMGRDKNEEEKYIMEFKDGKFERVECADLDGLDTDDEGRIKEIS